MVRQTDLRQTRGRGFSPHYQSGGHLQRRYFSTAREPQVPPTDPKFAGLVRSLYKIIKMVHHLQNVTPEPDQPGPRMIARMVDILASMIKPAVPTPNTVDMIVGNAKNWGHNTLIILQDHYKEGLENQLKDLSKQFDPNWKTAFEVATRWARRNLARITQDVLDHAEALIMSCGEDEGKQDGEGEDSENIQQQEEVQQIKRGGAVLPASQAHFLEEISEIPSDPGSSSAQKEAPLQQKKKATPQKTEKGQQQAKTLQTDCLDEVNIPDPDQVPPTSRPMCTVATMTEQKAESTMDWVDIEEWEENEDFLPPDQGSPKSQRTRRSFQKQAPQEDPNGDSDWGLQQDKQQIEITEADRQQSGIGAGALHLLEGDQLVDLDQTPTLMPQIQLHAAQVHRDGQSLVDLLEDLQGPISQNLPTSHTSSPKPHIYKPTRHINTDRKLVDWSLRVMKKWIIVGDSNLSRIPMYPISDLQIDSYPGANFRHAEAILAKATSQVMVEKVVLSFGLNSRAQKAKETAIKQMQAAVRMAKRQFPYAEIWVPLINYSSSLPLPEKETLHKLNTHISRNMPFIKPLKEARDGVGMRSRGMARAFPVPREGAPVSFLIPNPLG
ncbi:hypothetical protein Q8A73_020805 [Channa argus]|nr:hypothetical protein Q8A73_020805 [Channa argus]